MSKIIITAAMLQQLTDKQLQDKHLLLITEDAGGRYSQSGGACSIGSNFALIELAQPDPEYNVPLANDAGIDLKTSDYDLTFLGPGLKLDYLNYQIVLRDDSGLLDSSVMVAKGADIVAKFKAGFNGPSKPC